MKILIAEDDLTSRSMLTAITSKCGFDAIAVEDGEAAWEIMQQADTPLLLLLDWEMPKLSGLELCKRIRQLETDIPPYIIMLTSRSTTSDIVSGLEAGANEYITKPFDNTELCARLEVGRRMLGLQLKNKQAEEKQASLQIQLQQAQKMEAIGQLTGGIAHDFNNILASMLGFTELCTLRANEIGDDAIKRYLNEISKSGERARDLVAQMLTFSREGQAGSSPLQLEPIINDSITMLEHIVPSNIKLHIDIDAGLPAVMSNPVQVHQLLMNLCINARDAIENNGTIDISLKRIKANERKCSSCHDQLKGEYIDLSVKDSGNGIDQKTLERIFDPFFTTKAVGKGTGMGLSVVHGIMHEHGGHIQVDSSTDQGTTFHLMFLPAEEQTTAIQDTAGKPESITGKQIKGHALIVDDELSVATLIKELLGSAGCEATIETDSQKACTMILQQPDRFDLLITDQTMPNMTGMELIKEVFTVRPNLPVILCSGYSDQINEDSAKTIGIQNYMNKPLNIHDFLNKVGSLLQSSSG